MDVEAESLDEHPALLRYKKKIEDEYDQENPALHSLTDPFACFCRCNFRKIGQSYVLYEHKAIERGALQHTLILVGPHWIGVVVTVTIIVVASFFFIRDQCLQLPWYYTVFALGFMCMTLRFLYQTSCLDPGIVLPRYHDKEDNIDDDTVRLTVTEEEDEDEHDHDSTSLIETGRSRPAAKIHRGGGQLHDDEDETVTRDTSGTDPHNVPVSDVPVATVPTRDPNALRPQPGLRQRNRAYCDICDVHQERYTEHCEDCGVCIEDYDHHCPWMGKCIGKKNMCAFKLFNVSWVLYIIFVIGVSIQNVKWGELALNHAQGWKPGGRTP